MSCKPALRSIFGVDASSGQKVIAGIHLPFVTCTDLRCTNLWVDSIKTPVTGGGTFSDGTVLLPGIAFTDQLSTGIYRPGSGQVGISGSGTSIVLFSSGGIELQSGAVTTSAGDLVINPAGSNVDFSGKNLINVGGIFTNPNRYEVIGAQVTTLDATPTVILTIPTVSAAYTALVDVAVASGTSSGSYSVRLQIKNTGVATVNTMSIDRRFDAPINAAVLTVNTSGTDVRIIATGIAVTTIKWFSAATVTRSLY